MNQDPRPVIVALDFPDERSTLGMLSQLDPSRCRVKVGKELFTRCGPDLVRRIIDDGFEVFLDLKFHDIPNTTAAAVQAAAELGVWMVNVHASGGEAMMMAARAALGEKNAPLLIAVTVLTSMAQSDLQALGITASPEEQVSRLARLAADCGLDGVVCSAQETPLLRQSMPADFALVTPGIRPAGSEHDDQIRIETPASAMRKGSSYLVIGRPITRAEDPDAALLAILAEINGKK